MQPSGLAAADLAIMAREIIDANARYLTLATAAATAARGRHQSGTPTRASRKSRGGSARVIDESWVTERSRRGELEGGSRIGARYRHTTPEMAARVIQALDTRLTLTIHAAEAIIQRN